MNNMFDKTLKVVREYPIEICVRALGVVASLTFFYYFPMLVFITYMGYKGFFAYDMFTSGRVGLDSFYMASELLTIILSLYVAGFITLLIRRHTAKNPDLAPPYKAAPPYESKNRWHLFGALFINLAIFLLLAFQIVGRAYKGPRWNDFNSTEFADAISLFFGIVAISCWTAMHIGVVIYQRAKRVFVSLGLGVALLVGACLVMPQAIAKMLDGSLQYFGVGGGLPLTVSVEDGQQARQISSKLVLLTPTAIFAGGESHQVMVFDRSKVIEISIDNKSAFHR